MSLRVNVEDLITTYCLIQIDVDILLKSETVSYKNLND